jgi:methyltransferase (TIGR00027 family)
MTASEPLVRNISDTALFAAIYRARESERPDALFHDPFARRLAGERGEQIAKSMPFSERATWAWIARTVVFDDFIKQQVAQGADTIINLAAGLDARPYRMSVPSSLKWVEVDLPGILEYKEDILRDEKPLCLLERIRLDLGDVNARRELFARLATASTKTLVVTEGLLVYFSSEEVAALAGDLAVARSFQHWALDIASPGLLKMIKQRMGPQIGQGSAAFKFAPEEGPEFFAPHGWRAVEVRSMLKTAAHLKRLSPWMRFLSLLPESNGRQGSRPWSAVCLFGNSADGLGN